MLFESIVSSINIFIKLLCLVECNIKESDYVITVMYIYFCDVL